jgi:hypothetical protein
MLHLKQYGALLSRERANALDLHKNISSRS